MFSAVGIAFLQVGEDVKNGGLIPGWQAPTAPQKYPDLTVVKFVAEFGHGFRWHLDFSRQEGSSPVGRFFASDAQQCPQIDWPWCEGVTPSDQDWVEAGFTVVKIVDLANDISVGGKGVGDIDAGSTKHLPPTLSLQFYPLGGNSGWQPYVGVGVNWTYFFDEDVDGELKDALGAILGAEKASLSLEDSWGLSAQAGVDIPLGDQWGINLAVWYIDISTEAKLKTDVGTVEFDVDIDPWVYNVGIFYRF